MSAPAIAPDTHGPRGTYGCACVDRDSVQCAAIRYGMDHWGEACECPCHRWDDEPDDYTAEPPIRDDAHADRAAADWWAGRTA